MDFEKELSQKENDAGQITCWCLTVGLHQEFGVGAVRLDRVSAEMIHLEEEHEFIMAMYGSDKARKQRIEWLEGKVSESSGFLSSGRPGAGESSRSEWLWTGWPLQRGSSMQLLASAYLVTVMTDWKS